VKKLLFSLLLVFVCNVVAMDVEEQNFGCYKITKTEDWFTYSLTWKYDNLSYEIENFLKICEYIFTSKTSIPLDVGITDDQFEFLEKLYKYWLGYYAHRHVLYHKNLSGDVFNNDRMIKFIGENYGDGKCITNVKGLCFRGKKESLTSEVVQDAYDYFLDVAYGEIFQYLNKVGHLPVELIDIIKQYVYVWELHQNCHYKRTTIMVPRWVSECIKMNQVNENKNGNYIFYDNSKMVHVGVNDFLDNLLADVPTQTVIFSSRRQQ